MRELGKFKNEYHNVFANICVEYTQDNAPIELDCAECFYDPDFIAILVHLEKKGFILSTEISDKLIALKPLGITCRELPIYDPGFYESGLFTNRECIIFPLK